MSNRLILSGVFGAVSTVLGEAATRLLVYYKIGQIDLYQFHSLFLTVDQSSWVLGLIVSLIIGCFIGTTVYNRLEKRGSHGIALGSIMSFVFAWFLFEIVYTVFFAGLMDVARPINDHYVYLAGMAISGLALGLLMKLIVYRKA